MAVDAVNGRVFCTGDTNHFNMRFDGSDVNVIRDGSESPHPIAVDPIGKKVYWASGLDDFDENQPILRASYDGSAREVIVNAPFQIPVGLAFSVPEPASAPLVAAGLVGMAVAGRRTAARRAHCQQSPGAQRH
jgi:hypothetical protein